MSDPVLFIGGPEDGKYHKVEDSKDSVMIPKEVETVVDPVDGCRSLKWENVYYSRRLFTNGMQFFVEDSIKTQDVFAMLVANYRPNTLVISPSHI